MAKAARFCDVVALCDVDSRQAEKAKNHLSTKADIVSDYRKLLERKDVDMIINGTPDHWHTKINVDACRAGKDVYAEKPLTLDHRRRQILSQGRRRKPAASYRSARSSAARSSFRRRSSWSATGASENFSRSGWPCPGTAPRADRSTTQPVPEGSIGIATRARPRYATTSTERTHKSFRWLYIYAGGIVTDWGNHHVDIAHWGMDCENTGPVSIEARGLFPNKGKARIVSTRPTASFRKWSTKTA